LSRINTDFNTFKDILDFFPFSYKFPSPFSSIVKKVNPFRKITDSMNHKRVFVFVDRISFASILIVWLGVVFGFGMLYFVLQGSESYLLNTVDSAPISSVFEAIYFSFVAATTTGFGDIVPFGLHRLLSIIEVVFGLLLLAVVTSKLVSMKQNVILEELYDASVHEQLTRIRSTLLLFRQNINRLITRTEDKKIRKSELSDVTVHIATLEHVLDDLVLLSKKSTNNDFAKSIDSINAELLANSVLSSLEKLNELFELLFAENILLVKFETVVVHTNHCLQATRALMQNFKELHILSIPIHSEIDTRVKQITRETEETLNAPLSGQKI
jgi:potassium channel LctB